MTLPNRPRYAARLNAFKLGLPKGATAADMIARAAGVAGIDAADLNYPDHFVDHTPAQMAAVMADAGLALNGLAMRYYTDPGFRLGAFTHPDPKVRQAALDLTRRGLDALAAMGGQVMTLWLGQDGVDYSFQGDFGRMWNDTVAALADVADHNPDLDIAVEYKPNEPRAFALLPDAATTLLALREAGRANLGLTLDFAHVLYAGEIPAQVAALAARQSRLLGVHLNDGYGKRDDGLMVGSVHPVHTVELFVELHRIGYDGVIYFDTFPDHGGLNPEAEAATNVVMADRLREVAARLAEDPALAAAIARQDAATSLRIVADAAGEAMLAVLDRAGVDRTQVHIDTGPSGMSVAILRPDGSYGAVVVSAANLRIEAEAIVIPDETRIIVLQNEVPEAVNLRVAQAARARGAQVVLNAAPARPLASDLRRLVDFLVVNAVEAADLLGLADLDDPASAAAALAAGGSSAVIVTLGAAGLVLCDGASARHPAFPVRAVSSHGAGDAFVGALAARLAAGDRLARAARFAQGAAALHVAAPVAARDRVTPDAVRQLIR